MKHGELHRLDKTVYRVKDLGLQSGRKNKRIRWKSVFGDSFEDECYLTQQLLCLQPIPQSLASIYITCFISLFLDKKTTRKPNCLQKYILHFLVFIFQSCLPYIHLFFSKSLSILPFWHSPKPISTMLSLTSWAEKLHAHSQHFDDTQCHSIHSLLEPALWVCFIT